MGNQHAKKQTQILTGSGVVYVEYPVITGAAGIAVATGVGANTYSAADVVLMAAATITTEFWFCSVTPTAGTATGEFVVDVRDSAAAHIFAFRCSIVAAQPNVGAFRPAYPILIAPSLGISARSASVAGTQTISLSVCLATGL